MSAHLDLVRSIYADWERGDYFRSAAWAHPDIEVAAVGGPDPGSWAGLTVVANAFRDHLSAWGEYLSAVEEYLELDDERVFVLVRVVARGKTSGLQAANNGAHLFEIHDDRVTRLVIYWDRDHGLTDVGLKD